MQKKISIIIFILILLLCFPPKVYANQLHTIFYYDIKNSRTKLMQEEINFHGDFSRQQITFIIFDNLINSKRMFIPKNSRLISIQIKDKNLILNLSNEIKNYGGSYYEQHLLNQIKLTAQNLQFDSLTILIDGQKQYLPEGTIF